MEIKEWTYPAVALDTRNAIRFMKVHGAWSAILKKILYNVIFQDKKHYDINCSWERI